MTTKYLTLEDVLRLHFQVIEDFGGSHGIRDQNQLRSAVESPKQVIFGNEQYPTLFDKAAVYLRNIVGDHAFLDGNKRTAITVCGIFLARNGITISTSPKALEEFTIDVATKHLGIADIVTWLKLHCQ